MSDQTAEMLYEVRNGVATITLNRPHRKNAFTLPMIDRWVELLHAADTDDSVGAIITTGAGGAFCSGIDLAALAEIEPTAAGRRHMLTGHIHHVALTLDQLDKPVIAVVRGAAVGAGMDMALMCDMRFVGESAYFTEQYVNIGVVPGDGGCYYLPRIVGPAKALEILLSGEPVGAAEALRIGLANRLHPDEEVLEQAQLFAEKLAAQPPLAVQLIKRTMYQSMNTDLRTALNLVASHMGVVMTSADHAEALAAQRDKRPAHYTGS
ncbi:MAG: enoyl-CoA hydratase [Frankiales bacterium]|nr:enoyl-CoA hydratase [Frankiales bacterium]